jgi:RNA recognition motif-containing protein
MNFSHEFDNSNIFSICVKNIESTFTDDDLKDVFKETGFEKIKNIRIFPKSKYGFVEFDDFKTYRYWLNKGSKV